MNKILVLGYGGHARASINVIEVQNKFEIYGLIKPVNSKDTHKIMGYEIIGTDLDLKDIRNECSNALIGVGQLKSSSIRKLLYYRLKDLHYTLPNIFSLYSTQSSHVQIGDSNIFMHNSVVGPNVNIGNNNIINTGAIIEHDCQIGDHCHISTNTCINGNSVIGSGTFVGSGSTISNNLSIGKNCFISIGTTVKDHLNDNERI